MTAVANTYLTRLDKYLMSGVPLEDMAMTAAQKLRTRIVEEAYQVWISEKQIRPLDIIRRIARRRYAAMVREAQLNPTMAKLCKELGIEEGVTRSHTEIYNDITALNYIIGHFEAPTENIEKAKVIEASDWLISEGMKTGDSRSVSKGAELKMTMHNNFEEKQNDYGKIAQTAINITGDVSVIKVDRVNYTDEEKAKIAKRFGLTQGEADKVLKEARSEYIDFEPVEEEVEMDFIESAQKEMEGGEA